MSNSPETLTSDDCFRLMDSVVTGFGSSKHKSRCVRDSFIFRLMLDAGLRVGELVRLRVGQLLINSVPVTSLDLVQSVAEKGCLRLIPLNSSIQTLISDMSDFFWSPLHCDSNSFALLNARTGRPLTCRQVQRIVAFYSLRALGRKIHPHVLRHTFASRLMRVTNASVVQALLGHKHLSSTQVYCHPNGDDLRKAIDSV